jgi:hypothetical protein
MVKTDAILVNMPEELLNGAKWHLLQAERYATEGEASVFSLWQEVRATTVFAFTAVESFLNTVADEYVQRNPDLEQVVKDYLTEKRTFMRNGELENPERYISIDEKLSGWTRVITGKVFDKSDVVWQNFQKVKSFRDDLVHYKPQTRPSIYDRGTIEMARMAVEAALLVIQRFYACQGHPVAPWVTAPYRKIGK